MAKSINQQVYEHFSISSNQVVRWDADKPVLLEDVLDYAASLATSALKETCAVLLFDSLDSTEIIKYFQDKINGIEIIGCHR